MKIIGITGKIGSGKSKLLERVEGIEGVSFAVADEVSHELIKKGNEGYNKLVEVFGDEIIGGDGEIDKKKLSDIIFSDEKKRAVVNSLIHPLVKNKIIEDMTEKEKAGRICYFVESAILMESHFDVFCDELWYVYADRAVRKDRVVNTRGIAPDKFDAIDEAQKGLDLVEEEYFTLEVPFGIKELDEADEVKYYKSNPLWITFDNSNNLLINHEFDAIAEALIRNRL